MLGFIVCLDVIPALESKIDKKTISDVLIFYFLFVAAISYVDIHLVLVSCSGNNCRWSYANKTNQKVNEYILIPAN